MTGRLALATRRRIRGWSSRPHGRHDAGSSEPAHVKRPALSSPTLWFWGAVLLVLALVALVAIRSDTLAVAFVAGLGLLVIAVIMLGSREGSLALMSVFLLVL